MPTNNFNGRIMRVQQQFIDQAMAAALALARTRPHDQFAQTLAAALPHDGRGTLWCDLDLLTDAELALVAQWQP
jgi:hypothetical protein